MSSSAACIRALFLADAVFEDLPGGSRVAARELALGLAQRGHQVIFLVARQGSDAPDDEQRGAIRIIRYQGAGKASDFVRKGYEACAKLCSKHSFDLVHTHFAYSSVGPLRAVPRSVPRFRTFHGPWDEEGWLEDIRHANPMGVVKAAFKRRIRYQIEAGSLRNSAKVLTLSDCFAQMAEKRYNVKSDRIEIIPGGTDTTRFFPTADKAAVRDRLQLPIDRRILFTVRRLAPRMGLDNLVTAMKTVVNRNPDVLLIIGGKGPERAKLDELVRSLGLESQVRLVGFIPDGDLAAYYQASDVFILPTIALEGFGLVITEALASGVPVIGTPVGAIPEILSGLDANLVAKGSDPKSLSAAIDSFLNGNWSIQLPPERLRKFVEDRYTWDRHVTSVEAAYRDILHNRK